jgi:Tfp pilus assembly protein PilO
MLEKLKNIIEAEWALTIVLILIVLVSVASLGYSFKINQEISDKYEKTKKQNEGLMIQNHNLKKTQQGLSKILINQHEMLEMGEKIIRDLIKRVKELEDENRLDIDRIT